MMLELDKVMSLYESAEKEKVALVKKIQQLQGLDQDDEEEEDVNDQKYDIIGSEGENEGQDEQVENHHVND